MVAVYYVVVVGGGVVVGVVAGAVGSAVVVVVVAVQALQGQACVSQRHAEVHCSVLIEKK